MFTKMIYGIPVKREEWCEKDYDDSFDSDIITNL